MIALDEMELTQENLRGTPKQNGKIIRLKNQNDYKSNNNIRSSKETNNHVTYKSSFHTQSSTKHSLEHMERKSKVTYLLIHDSNVNDNKKYDDVEKFKKEAEKIYKEKIGQKMQSKSKLNLVKEAVLNTKPNTTIEEIENTFKNLNKKFTGHHIIAISIHRDEGVFIDSKYDLRDLEYTAYNLSWRNIKLNQDVTNEVIDYAPNRNIFYNQEDKNWYFDKEFENKADVSKFQQKINYHAHVLYSNFNKDTGKTARLDRNDMRELQTIVANSLGMQRGNEFSKNKRMNHWQLKKSIDAKRDLKMNNNEDLARLRDLKNLMNEQRNNLKEQNAKRPDYAKLEQINKDLQKQIKNKELSLDDMKKIVNEKMKTIDYQNKLLDEKDHLLKEYKEVDKNRTLLMGNEIMRHKIKVKDGLFKSKELYIYQPESVEKYIEVSKKEEEKLRKENEGLKETNSKLNEFVSELKGHLKEVNLEKLLNKVVTSIPKVQKQPISKNKFHDKGYGRE